MPSKLGPFVAGEFRNETHGIAKSGRNVLKCRAVANHLNHEGVTEFVRGRIKQSGAIEQGADAFLPILHGVTLLTIGHGTVPGAIPEDKARVPLGTANSSRPTAGDERCA
jgi:hypothetical protein